MRPTFRELQLVMRENRTAQNFAGSETGLKKSLHNGCTKGVCARVGAAAKV
jgi:hypothetical protein